MPADYDDWEKRLDDLWAHRYRKLDESYRYEQTARDLDSLRRRLDLAAAGDPTEVDSDLGAVLLPDKLGRDQLKQEIYSQRQAVLARISDCSGLDRVIRRRWIETLEDIDVFQPQAESRVLRLKDRVSDYRQDSTHHSASSIKSDLGLVAHELWQLAQLCNSYQYRYGPAPGV
jgi:hypothetical protein